MGNLCSGPGSPARYDDEIARKMDEHKKREKSIKKLLLLGSGSSGKSTLFKQLKCIHGSGFEDTELQESRHVIRQNCVSGILVIVKKANEFANEDPEFTKLDLGDNEVSKATDTVIGFANESFTDQINYDSLGELGDAIYLLWQQPSIKATYARRGDNYSFPDNMNYFFDKAQEIMSPDFHPTPQDVLKTRVRTTGMIEYQFELNKNTFHVFDVGGQRNERKKWIHSFENVTAVIFVAALNGFNAVLFEDEKKNAMHESIELFDEICNSKWFRQTEMILFLNKNDLFEELLRQGKSLAKCFDPSVWESGDIWKGPDYVPCDDPAEDEQAFAVCYETAINFVQDQYLKKNSNPQKVVFAHVTTATDPDNVKKVFWDVQNIIIRSNLKRAQLL